MPTRTYAPEVLEYLRQFDPRLLQSSEGRRLLTRLEPKLFALLYLVDHISDTNGHVSFSEVHDDWYRQMQSWVKVQTIPRAWRKAFVAPRSMGKSTTWFTVAPLWAGAHGHSTFMMAFADAANQAEQHLATFKKEIDHNQLLRRDFPEFTRAARKPSGASEADNRTMYSASSGFTFSAKGVDSASLGAKQGSDRPDVLIFDDIEPPGGVYSAGQAEKRRETIVNGLLPLNELARVVFVGTVVMVDSLVHQMVKTVTTTEPAAAWVTEEAIRAHYYPPILVNDDGSERSVWPSKWSLEYLQSIRTHRSFALNFLNDPLGLDGVYWQMEDFSYGEIEGATNTLLSIDPAVTTKSTSDYTGLAVVTADRPATKCCVEYAEEVRLVGASLRDHVLKLLERFPHIGAILIEVNQGGELFEDIFHNMPVKVKTMTNNIKKELRAAEVLNYYQRGRVTHARPLPKLEAQMIGFPKAPHDDMVDAAGTGVAFFLKKPEPKRIAQVANLSYV